MAVFVLDQQKTPLMPCSEKRARLLLERGRAVVVRLHPFTIRLKDRIGGETQPLHLSLDPGSKTTGIALARNLERIDLETVRERLTARRAFRRRRRSKNLRHRAPRCHNRTKPQGWLAPSLRHRLDTTLNWVNRLQRLAPITSLRQELVRFDTQALQNPEISGVEYQQGELAGYEAREYLLEKWHRTCAYCGATQVPLEIEHIQPKSRGGSDRVSNLTLACRTCNQRKGRQPIEDFLSNQPERLRRLQSQAKAPLRDAAAVNATRWALFERLKATGLPVSTGSGGQTKYNRQRLGIPKTHALDAACVGPLTALHRWNIPTLTLQATGRGRYQRTRLNRFGFPRGYLMREKRVHGFQTGDRVIAEMPTGKNAGIHVGRVAVRASGRFNIQTATNLVQGISHRHCRVVQRADGYGYSFTPIQTEEARQVG
ncbi:RNA-guided endonuclease IscB [Rhabdochromatium marinum]|uniref:RNA-guided endonuclease IscB n=1 Tax=Rhabdochromatium marinum TaxID=48729 RepID=UPI001905DE30|nr:RNA-guided endonuclease IscB [Rhabdochromatium marinum]MBK1649486.1 HNH endonuclease [Rhabdochromatium marinum]